MIPAKGRRVPIQSKISTAGKSEAIKVGFLPLVDAAPLIGASAWGDWERENVSVRLSREIGWATIREKLIFGDLDAVQIPAPMAVAVRLGLGAAPTEVLVPWILNRQGNAITLSLNLRKHGVTDAISFGRLARSQSPRKMTFGVVARHSMHAILLSRWLASAGISMEQGIHTVVIPPAQMVRSLSEGLIDGFCAGEPWNAAAVAVGSGWCAAIGAEILPRHVEKVLLMRSDFGLHRPEELSALLRGLRSSSRRCDTRGGREELVTLLKQPEWLDTSADILSASLLGPFDRGDGTSAPSSLFNQFHETDCNIPSLAAARGVLKEMEACGMVPQPNEAERELPLLFREDLYKAAFAQRSRFSSSLRKANKRPNTAVLTSN
jgi:NitT/TauT family transport system ATP-binding protein